MRVLVAPFGTDGDVRPLVSLALRLREEGHEVRAASTPNFEELFRGFEIPFQPFCRDGKQWLTENGRTIMGHPFRGMKLLMQRLKEEMRLQFDQLPGIVRNAEVLIGSSLLLAGPSVAEAFSIPYRHALFCPQALVSSYH